MSACLYHVCTDHVWIELMDMTATVHRDILVSGVKIISTIVHQIRASMVAAKMVLIDFCVNVKLAT